MSSETTNMPLKFIYKNLSKRCVSMRSRHSRKYVKELAQIHAAKLSLIRVSE